MSGRLLKPFAVHPDKVCSRTLAGRGARADPGSFVRAQLLAFPALGCGRCSLEKQDWVIVFRKRREAPLGGKTDSPEEGWRDRGDDGRLTEPRWVFGRRTAAEARQDVKAWFVRSHGPVGSMIAGCSGRT